MSETGTAFGDKLGKVTEGMMKITKRLDALETSNKTDADSRSYDVTIDEAKKGSKSAKGMFVSVTASSPSDADKKAIALMKGKGYTDIKTGSIARSGKDI